MRHYFVFLTMTFLLIMSAVAYAQKQTKILSEEQLKEKYPKAKIEEAAIIGKDSLESWKKKREQALKIAKRYNLPIRLEDKNHKVIELQYFKNSRPVYFKTFNLDAAETISTDEVWQGPNNLNGEGITAAIWDGGMVRNTHQELVGRVTQKDTASKPNYHATHVAGTMIASGYQFSAKGMAYEADLDAYDWGADLTEILLAPQHINVSNHSYGITAGWEYDDILDVWFWYGDTNISETEDYKFGFYTDRSATIDNYINYFRPYHLIVAAVGNDRDNTGPGPNGGHFVLNDSATAWVWSTTTRDPDGGSNHYDCIPGGLATAKNVLTVGAVYDINGGWSQSGDVVMTDFSSWGPTDDGRIKPDVVANGYQLFSCTSINDNSYGNLSGASMAAPNVSGSVALLLQKWNNAYSGESLWASSMKGLIIHTADEAGPVDGPDYQFGWGLMNTQKAVDVIDLDIQDGPGSHIAQKTYTGVPIEIPINYHGTAPLVVTICWSDPHGTSPLPSLNDTTKMLVNDLDLVLIDESQTITKPYVLDPKNPSQPATNGDNDRDNVEKVFVPTGPAGVYTARITHEGMPFTQDFSIIVTGGIMNDTTSAPPPNSYQITWDQRLSDNTTSVGKLGLWITWGYWRYFNMPFSFWQDEGTAWNGTVKATDDVFYNEKFHHWNNTESDILIYHNFTINEQNPELISKLLSLSEASIRSYLKSAETYTSDSVDFKDPWYFEESPAYNGPNGFRNQGMNAPFETHATPFELTIGSDYKGVFLNQGLPSWNPPYYSVRAHQQLTAPFHGRDITWYFQNWDGEHVVFQHPDQLETALVFQADGAVARANYKGHLVTNIAAPGGTNSRLLVQDQQDANTWYCVYEDNARIYFTFSGDNGQTWMPEQPVCDEEDINHINHNPSIASYPGNTKNRPIDPVIGFCWVNEDENAIACRLYNTYNYEWRNTAKRLSFREGDIHPAFAAASRNLEEGYSKEFYVLVPQHDGAELCRYTVSGGTYILETVILPLNGTRATSSQFAMTSDPEEEMLYICWQDSGRIYYTYYNVQNGSTPNAPLWVSPAGMQGSSDSHPTIAYDGNGLVHIAWQHFDGETGISFRHQFFNAMDPHLETPVKQVSLRGVNLTRPSIGCSTDGHTVAAVVQAGSQWRWLFFDGSQWTLSEEAIAGNLAGINAYGENFMAAWVDAQQGLPYLVNQTLLPQSALQERDNGSEDTDYREQLLNLSYLNNLNLRGKALLRLGNVKLQTAGGESEWPFFNPGDSLNTTEFLRTVPITVTPATASARLHYRVQLEDYNKPAQLLNAPLVRLGVFTPGSAQPLAVLFKVDLNALSNGSHLFEDSLTVDLSPWQNQTIELRMENIFALNGNNGRKPACIAEQVFRTGGGNNERMLAKTANENENPVLPKAFRLLPNYPNPFNPETRITFELPQASPVRLEIYDMSGRKIKTLVNKAYPAGRYEVIWNGRDGQNRPAASGIYLLRLRAGAFNATQKMVLMK